MKHILALLVFGFVHLCAADRFFSIGTERVQFEVSGTNLSEQLLSFIEKDITDVFFPLRSISNIIDVAAVQESPSQPHGLTFREWYPEGFVSGWSVTNRSGTIVFQMKENLVNYYMSSYINFSSISNKFDKLKSLMNEINSCSITNRTDAQSMSLIFIPEKSTHSLTPGEVRSFIHLLVQNRPFTVSVLDCRTESVQGVPCTIAASKTALLEDDKWVFAPIEWIYWNESWKFYHPSVWETVPSGD